MVILVNTTLPFANGYLYAHPNFLFAAIPIKALYEEKPDIFIAGHSHILKVKYDNLIDCLHINPGAAGKQGWQQVRTLIKFTIDGKEIKDLEVIELAKQR